MDPAPKPGAMSQASRLKNLGHVQLQTKKENVSIVENAGTKKFKVWYMVNIKLFFDYPKRRDGFTGRENRRYWLINTKTNIKIRITEKIYDGIQASKLL